MGFQSIKPMVMTSAALLASNVLENDYAAWSSGATYALGDRRIYVSGDNHWIVESKQNSNTNHVPTGLDSDAWWLLVSSTNRWKMFDKSIQSQTTRADNITIQIRGTGRIDAITFLNLDAKSISITITDAIDGVVYAETLDLISLVGINTFSAWFFEPTVKEIAKVVLNLPKYLNALIDIVIENTGSIAKCGACILGSSKDYGLTQFGMSFGIRDYSVKEQDDFGGFSILERGYSNELNMTVWIDSGKVDYVFRELASVRAQERVYIGSSEYGSSIVYGYYEDFNINVAYSNASICTIQLISLS